MKRTDIYCWADKGKHFVLTEKGKREWASYKNYEVGKPIDRDDSYVVCTLVDGGAVVEVDDPDWVTLPGFKVVRKSRNVELTCGNSYIFHDREMAERYRKNYEELFKSWGWNDAKPYIVDAVYEGKRPVENKEYEGKVVFVKENWFCDIGQIGDLVEHRIAMDIAECVPPRNFSTGYIQCGEPESESQQGTLYATFVRLDNDVWEYKGNCLAGHTEQDWTPIPRVRGVEVHLV